MVDSIEAAVNEAGEITQAVIRPHQVVELGELMMVHHAAGKESEEESAEEEKSQHE